MPSRENTAAAASGDGSGWRPLRPVLRRGQVAVDVREARAGNVRFAVAILAPAVGLREVVAHVDDDERRIAKPCGKVGGGNQRAGHRLSRS